MAIARRILTLAFAAHAACLTASALVRTAGAQAPAWNHVLPLPTPDGPHAVGTVAFLVTDSTRATSRHVPTRRIGVRAFYPAAAGSGVRDVPYAGPPALLDSMLAHQYLDLEAGELAPWRAMRLAAATDAAAASPRTPRPVIVLSHGLGVASGNYAALAQSLASHGYVVLALEHPLGGFAFGADGRVLAPGSDSLHYPDRPYARVVHDWAEDAALAVRVAAASFASGPRAPRLRLDTTRVAVVGHSIGGAAALEACRTVPLMRACVDFDGDVFGDVGTQGVRRPFLVLLSEPDHRGQRPPRDSAERAARARFAAMGRARDSGWAAIQALSRDQPSSVIKVLGTGHFSFSDAPFTIQRQLRDVGATLAPSAMHARMVREVLRFLATHLAPGRGTAATPARPYPMLDAAHRSVAVRSRDDRATPTRIPMLVDDERVYVPVRGATGDSAWFILDTGAGATLLDVGMARAWGITVERTQSTTGAGGGQVAIGRAPAQQLRVGSRRFAPSQVRVAPLDSLLGPSSGRHVAGIIGSEFFVGRVVALDFARGEVVVDATADTVGATRVPITVSGGIPYAHATLTDWAGTARSARLLVDLGAKHNLLVSESFLARTGVVVPRATSLVAPLGAGMGGRTRYRYARLPALALTAESRAALAWTRVVAGFSEGGVLAGGYHDGLLGLSLLRGYCITFDYPRGAMWLAPIARAPWSGIGEELSGLFLVRERPDAAVVVDEVAPGTPADAAAIATGDTLEALDGAPTGATTLGAVRERLRRPGPVRMRVRRQGVVREVTLVLVPRL
ncbi:MAG: aspartyl protease family protein [Gemmatimonadetes bacterium]|nr:aspartyl protease family protein [Gemmatimonadota bacterium]